MVKKCIAATVIYALPMLTNNSSLPCNESITFDGVALLCCIFPERTLEFQLD